MIQLTPPSLELFLDYARDAENWEGAPRWCGNVGGQDPRKDNGYLTQMKRAGLITTSSEEGKLRIHFTDAGRALAARHGIVISAD